MFQYIIKRLLLMIVTLFGITIITFVVTRLTPGDPAAMRVQGGSTAAGAYGEIVEQNRRNLGLDKPLLLNFNFEDRTFKAERALSDYLRKSEIWSKDGERRLGRITTIALKPAIDRLGTIGTEEEPIPESYEGEPADMAPVEERRERILDILPRLAGEPNLRPEGETWQEKHEWWKKWYEEHKGRYEEEHVQEVVRDYLAGEIPVARIQKIGGFAIPLLVEELDTEENQRLLRVNEGLSALTGFDFGLTEQNVEEQRGEVVQRWGSWWRREKVSYSDFSAFGDAVNIFVNTQYGLWVKQILTLDFGDSYLKKKPVIGLIKGALPVTLVMSFSSILISYLISIPLGIFSAIKRYTPEDKVITVILFILYSLPNFWVAGMLLMLMTGPPFLDWFPSRGMFDEGVWFDDPVRTWLPDLLHHMVLPIICLTYTSLAFISRQMRSAMLETIKQDFVRTAMAKGLNPRTVILKHALRNSLIPILTISAGLLPELIAGSVIIESIFTIPGMGKLTFEAILNRDYPIINAVFFFAALLTLIGILLADLSYAIVDPRITYD